MDQKKIGEFIAKCRKEKNQTQADLAEKLGVTEKSVSNWENGRNMPDLSLFKSLCENLNITINELMNGEKLSKENNQVNLDENIIKLTELA
ncbi:MAG: helix-turn-helix domain-containing protein, partial [Bacilli bacterium]|nr:helix-turn-helix domain-containing protein [Bacilli bacterium]